MDHAYRLGRSQSRSNCFGSLKCGTRSRWQRQTWPGGIGRSRWEGLGRGVLQHALPLHQWILVALAMRSTVVHPLLSENAACWQRPLTGSLKTSPPKREILPIESCRLETSSCAFGAEEVGRRPSLSARLRGRQRSFGVGNVDACCNRVLRDGGRSGNCCTCPWPAAHVKQAAS